MPCQWQAVYCSTNHCQRSGACCGAAARRPAPHRAACGCPVRRRGGAGGGAGAASESRSPEAARLRAACGAAAALGGRWRGAVARRGRPTGAPGGAARWRGAEACRRRRYILEHQPAGRAQHRRGVHAATTTGRSSPPAECLPPLHPGAAARQRTRSSTGEALPAAVPAARHR